MPAPIEPAGHRPRKRFGQNFLTDTGMVDKIVRAIGPRADQCLVEIGPGRGALTLPLLDHCPALHVLELDRDLAAALEAVKQRFPQLTIHQGDALKFDFGSLCQSSHCLRVVGNLPYNISTPLIFHLLDFHHSVADMHFMLQKEVVQRLAAAPGGKDYGRLSVMVQYFCRVDALFGVPPECFQPRPKVDSAVVRLTPHARLPHRADNLVLLQRVVSVCFGQRRKTLRNSLRGLLPVDLIDRLELDTQVRPDQLSVGDYVALANTLEQHHRDQFTLDR